METPVKKNTPVEKWGDFYVKREDLSCDPPGPPFAKVRGLWEHMSRLKREGVQIVGYTETSISMAGWGVAWAAQALGMQAIIFAPQYKEPGAVLRFHEEQWRKFGATLYPIKAGMARVNYNISKNLLRKEFGPSAVMLPLGLPFQETVSAVSEEVQCASLKQFKAIVTCVGSGTICAGLIRGLAQSEWGGSLVGVLCRSGDVTRKYRRIWAGSGIPTMMAPFKFSLVNYGYTYTQKVEEPCPFPCNPYYDRKAWKWLMDSWGDWKEGKKPVLFWNIGA